MSPSGQSERACERHDDDTSDGPEVDSRQSVNAEGVMRLLRATAAFSGLLVSGLAVGGSAAQAENGVTAGQFVVEPPR